MNIFDTADEGIQITVRAHEILELPEGVRLRVVDTSDGKPLRPDGQWPFAIEIWREKSESTDYVYLITADDPGGAFRLELEDELIVIPERISS
jgi:hypothetical protein